VSLFTVMESLIFVNTDSMNIVRENREYGMNTVCQHVTCLDLALGTYVDRMNTQVRLQNSLFRLAGRVNSELVGSMRNTKRMIRELFAIFTVQFNTQSRNTVLSKTSYLLFISWRRTRCFEHYTVCTSYCLWESHNLSKYVITCQSNLNCRFSSTKKKKIRRNLTVAWHRHPTELVPLWHFL